MPSQINSLCPPVAPTSKPTNIPVSLNRREPFPSVQRAKSRAGNVREVAGLRHPITRRPGITPRRRQPAARCAARHQTPPCSLWETASSLSPAPCTRILSVFFRSFGKHIYNRLLCTMVKVSTLRGELGHHIPPLAPPCPAACRLRKVMSAKGGKMAGDKRTGEISRRSGAVPTGCRLPCGSLCGCAQGTRHGD